MEIIVLLYPQGFKDTPTRKIKETKGFGATKSLTLYWKYFGRPKLKSSEMFGKYDSWVMAFARSGAKGLSNVVREEHTRAQKSTIRVKQSGLFRAILLSQLRLIPFRSP